jgi:hypothetical protein
MNLSYRFLLVLLLPVVLIPAMPLAHAVPPGKEISPIAVKELTVGLVPMRFAKSGKELSAATLVWLPKPIVKDCEGQTLAVCQERDHERRMEPYTASDGKQYESIKVWKGEVPRQVLIETISGDERYAGRREQLLQKLSRLPAVRSFLTNGAGKNSEFTMATIDSSNAIAAKVRWELWPNGENFSVLDIR